MWQKHPTNRNNQTEQLLENEEEDNESIYDSKTNLSGGRKKEKWTPCTGIFIEFSSGRENDKCNVSITKN